MEEDLPEAIPRSEDLYDFPSLTKGQLRILERLADAENGLPVSKIFPPRYHKLLSRREKLDILKGLEFMGLVSMNERRKGYRIRITKKGRKVLDKYKHHERYSHRKPVEE